MMADMKPKFLRFPGGNYLEGDTIETRFEWKKPWARSKNVMVIRARGVIARRTVSGFWNFSSGAKT